jgi:tripartite-type tricarboxylate transporter receptor subunit TctC
MLKHFVLLAALFVSGAVSAQPYPAKPLRFIVPDGPGSVSDLRARQLAVKLSEQLGQSVVIDNRPGGSFIVGAEAAAKAPADGYTIFLGSIVTHALNPLLFKTLPYRPNEDFLPVTMLSAGAMILVVNPSVAATSLRELLELSRAKPNQMGYGVVGLGSPGHLVMEQLKRETGAQFLMVPYKSSGTYIQDLMGGHMPVALNFWSIVGPHVKSGKMRALAVAAPRRLDAAPDIPTFAEAGVPGIEGYAWQGIFVPAGTSPALVARLNAEIARAINSPEIRNNLIETGAEVGGNSPEAFAAMIRADQEKWRRLAEGVSLAQQ